MAKKAMKKPVRKGTALVKASKGRAIAKSAGSKPKPTPTLSALDANSNRTIGDEVQIGALGLVELVLTDKEKEILFRPVRLDEVRIKPTSTGAVYVPHVTYTRWLNEAFNPGGWQLVQASHPRVVESGEKKVIITPHVLYVHGKPVAFANGEQDYHENNKDQTYGDALESTYASALRRVTKHLGMGLELWDPEWCRAFLEDYGVQVKVKKPWEKGDARTVWRLKAGRPLEYEQGPAGQANAARAAYKAPTPPRQAVHNPADSQVIDLNARQRLVNLVATSGRSQREVTDWLYRRFGVQSTAEIKAKDYNFICACIESPADLPESTRALTGEILPPEGE